MISDYMVFLGDEGRDAIVIKRILTEFDLPLIGPPTSVGNMYLGPLYYYMMAVPMSIFWLNPVAAAMMVAILGTISVGLIYYLSRVWFGVVAAFVAATLYAVSPVNIIYSRSSWNPNPAPFFVLLALISFYKAHQSKNYRWLILTGVASAFLIQMHYLALILLPVLGILWVMEILLYKVGKDFYKNTIYGILAFLFLMSPLVVFDFRHNFINFRALQTFFGNRETTVNLNFLNSLARTIPIYKDNLIGSYMAAKQPLVTTILSLIVVFSGLWGMGVMALKRRIEYPIIILIVWMLIGVLGLSLYKQNIYDHYLGFLNPVPYLFIGALIYLIGKSNLAVFKSVLYFLSGILFVWVMYLNIVNSPLKYPPNKQLTRTQNVAKFIIEKSGNKPFNFALIAKHNYDAAYQFYLDYYGHKPKQVPFEVTGQLFVVCEDEICEPVGHPKYEIAGFGWTQIESVQEFQGVKVFKLVPYEDPDKE